MKKRFLSIALFLLFVILFAGTTRAEAAGARLFFDPATGDYSINEEFTVILKIDTDGEDAVAADSLINFDSSRLEVQSVTKGTFFEDMSYDVLNESGRLTVYAFETKALQGKSGTGNLAEIKFKAIANGVASASFVCQAGSDTDSAIWVQDATTGVVNDVINCASNGSGSYTIGSSGGSTSTPVPTSASGSTSTPVPTSASGSTATPTTVGSSSTSTPTPSELPQTGIETPILIILLSGGIIFLLGTLLTI